MVVHRRAALMGVVTISAVAASLLYFWRFGSTHGLVPFLMAGALLLVAVVHGIAWRESRLPLLTVDMTGLMVRLGGRWVALPWGDVEVLEVAPRGRIADGRVVVQPRDERRALTGLGLRSRLAALLNRWLYDASLVVPFGRTSRASVDDIDGTLLRLADGRVPVVIAEATAEPVPTVELSGSHVWTAAATPAPSAPAPALPAPAATATAAAVAAEPALTIGATTDLEPAAPTTHRRLSAVVSALRSPGRRGLTSQPMAPHPATAGALALTDPQAVETEPLPELQELRRRAPEDEELDHPLESEARFGSTRSANVDIVIDATADLSAGTMRGIRQRAVPTPLADAASMRRTADEPAIATPVSPAAAVEPSPPAVAASASAPAAVAIGDRVRQARERLDISVDDLAERTRIRPYVIESIEVGDFSPCGGDFYARGHLRMLTGVLGMDPEPLLTSYDESLASAPVSPRQVFDAELSKGVVRPTGGGSRWGALVAAVLLLLLVWGIARIVTGDQSDANGTSRVSSGAGAQLAGDSAGAKQPAAQNISDLQVAPPEPTRVLLRATGAASRVVVWDSSHAVVFQGVLAQGAAKVLSARAPLRVMAVDGGAVELTAPGHPRADMGQPGERTFVRVT